MLRYPTLSSPLFASPTLGSSEYLSHLNKFKAVRRETGKASLGPVAPLVSSEWSRSVGPVCVRFRGRSNAPDNTRPRRTLRLSCYRTSPSPDSQVSDPALIVQ